MNRNRRLFIIVFIVFTAIVILFTIDMARRTTAPWNKKREVERALPTKQDGTAIDTAVTDDDTLLAPK
ncbi:hypothetical protein WBJ53_19820 [Spirosoma sp. SC4-14]|uniref:hypothetical protein n=1 Tax=Spirosoma sp. SC4-14 TaxID=3128900 RepID=UPI0030CD0C9B